MNDLSSLAQGVQNKRQPVSGAVADALREAIFRGVFKRGEPLRQDALAKQFSVSQVTIREAFRLLGEEGIVDIVPRRGAVVACLSPEDVDEIVELRVWLETMLIARTIPLLTKEDFDAAEKIVRRIDKAKSMNEQLEVNIEFHAFLYAKADRSRSTLILEKLRLALEPYLRLLWAKSDYKSRSQDDHHKILDRCKAGDIAGAQKILAAHITQTGNAISNLLRAE